MTVSDHPIASRPLGSFPPAGGSVFEDPGDEKSWHRSQRYESLKRFYEGREPAWYASAIRPLRGAGRVIDLGAGPGLTLEALRELGAHEVLGVDRWPGFARDAQARVPIVLHDLTLPMPFLASGSFDGVLSHYALDYVSPIGMRQVLREADRLLAPGGQLLLYLAAVGLGSGDETRTLPYTPAVMRRLLEEAGFGELEVESSPNGRNTVAKARRGPESPSPAPAWGEVSAEVRGEVQLSVAFAGSGEAPAPMEITAADAEREVTLGLDLSGASAGDRVAACVRVISTGTAARELQAWAWVGPNLVAAEALRLEFAPTTLRIRNRGPVEHVSRWAPGRIALEPPGNAYVRPEHLAPGAELEEHQRGAEGRRVIVASEAPADGEARALLGPGKNRFLVSPDSDVRGAALSPAALDRAWLAGLRHGLAIGAASLRDDALSPSVLWAAHRDVPVLVTGTSWEQLADGAAAISDIGCPLILADPALTGGGEGPPPPPVVDRVAAWPQAYALLGGAALADTPRGALDRLAGRILAGGTGLADGRPEEDENLRYLTERALLMRLRVEHGRPLADLGRRPSLSS